ncbi:MAG: hypothetical protein JNK82_42150 [Myxococcaceae bacterium]|nr:hypothetical protein [Myxococcaceae bacterium]
MKVLLLVVALAAAPKRPPAPLPLPAAPDTSVPTQTLFTSARAALDALEYQKALVLSEALVQRGDATPEMRVEGYWVQGQAIAVLRDPVEAEPAFRTLMRLEPGFEPRTDPGPKILATFRKVQVEERALAERLARDARARLVAGLALTGEPPARARGGRPLRFSFQLKDPTGAVDEVAVHYRFKGSTVPFSVLALTRSTDGRYEGEVPGEVTANEGGATLDFFVQATDGLGPLVARGDAVVPLAVELSAGKPGRALPRGWYHGALAATVVGVVSTLGLGAGALYADQAHRSLGKMADGVPANEWQASRLAAQTLIAAAIISLGVTAVLSVVTVFFKLNVEEPD